MIALYGSMTILHFNICMLMSWLVWNTHTIGQVGYDCSARSMGKAIDTLYNEMLEIEKDSKKILVEEYGNKFFSKIYTTKDSE